MFFVSISFAVLSELLKGEEDTLDFQEDLAKVFEAAKMYEFGKLKLTLYAISYL